MKQGLILSFDSRACRQHKIKHQRMEQSGFILKLVYQLDLYSVLTWSVFRIAINKSERIL